MKRFYPGPYGRTCGYLCRQLKATMPRLISRAQQGDTKLKVDYSDTIPVKLKQPKGGKPK